MIGNIVDEIIYNFAIAKVFLEINHNFVCTILILQLY